MGAHPLPKIDPSEWIRIILPCPEILPYVIIPVCKRSMKTYWSHVFKRNLHTSGAVRIGFPTTRSQVPDSGQTVSCSELSGLAQSPSLQCPRNPCQLAPTGLPRAMKLGSFWSLWSFPLCFSTPPCCLAFCLGIRISHGMEWGHGSLMVAIWGQGVRGSILCFQSTLFEGEIHSTLITLLQFRKHKIKTSLLSLFYDEDSTLEFVFLSCGPKTQSPMNSRRVHGGQMWAL